MVPATLTRAVSSKPNVPSSLRGNITPSLVPGYTPNNSTTNSNNSSNISNNSKQTTNITRSQSLGSLGDEGVDTKRSTPTKYLDDLVDRCYKRRHLVLNFDVNKTIVMVDSVTGKSMVCGPDPNNFVIMRKQGGTVKKL